MQKAQSANKINKILFLLIIIIISTACKSNSNKDIYLLKHYINDYRIEQKQDSILLGLDNYNGEVAKIINRYSSNTNIISDKLKDVLTEKNLEHFKKQIVNKNSIWDINFSKIDYLFKGENYPKTNRLKLLYISKPIYTIDGQYALIMKFRKSNDSISFLSSVEVYENLNNVWSRISKINRY